MHFSCFLALLLIAAILWKIKQKYDRYRRRQRLFVEMEQVTLFDFLTPHNVQTCLQVYSSYCFFLCTLLLNSFNTRACEKCWKTILLSRCDSVKINSFNLPNWQNFLLYRWRRDRLVLWSLSLRNLPIFLQTRRPRLPQTRTAERRRTSGEGEEWVFNDPFKIRWKDITQLNDWF